MATPVGRSSKVPDTVNDVEPKSTLDGVSSRVCSSYCWTSTVYVTDTGPRRLLIVGLTVTAPPLPKECDDDTEAPLSTETDTLVTV
jgi:hypothetical protein